MIAVPSIDTRPSRWSPLCTSSRASTPSSSASGPVPRALSHSPLSRPMAGSSSTSLRSCRISRAASWCGGSNQKHFIALFSALGPRPWAQSRCLSTNKPHPATRQPLRSPIISCFVRPVNVPRAALRLWQLSGWFGLPIQNNRNEFVGQLTVTVTDGPPCPVLPPARSNHKQAVC